MEVEQTNEAGEKADPGRDRKRLILVALVVIVAAGIFVFADLTGRDGPEEENGMARIDFLDAGFSIELPLDWVVYEQRQPSPQIPLVAGVPNTDNNMHVSLVRLSEPFTIESTTPESVAQLRQLEVEQTLLQPDLDLHNGEIVRSQRVVIGGINGWHYLYQFRDEAATDLGLPGLRSRFFLPQGQIMYQVLFQAIPIAAYEDLARTYDEIINSFRILDDEEVELDGAEELELEAQP